MQKIMNVINFVDFEQIFNLCMTFDDYNVSILKFNFRTFISKIILSKKFKKHELFVRNEFKNARVRI